MEEIQPKMCQCGMTQNSFGHCDRSHEAIKKPVKDLGNVLEASSAGPGHPVPSVSNKIGENLDKLLDELANGQI